MCAFFFTISYSHTFCSHTHLMKNKLKVSTKWNDIKTQQDVLEILHEIRSITYKFEEPKYLPLSIHNAKANFYYFCQGNLNNSEYFQRFKNYTDIATLFDGNLHDEAIIRMACRDEHDHSNIENFQEE